MRALVRLRAKAYQQQHKPEFKEQLDANFKELQKQIDLLERIVLDNVRDILLLAEDSPVTVIRTMEVVEMEDRARLKVFVPFDSDVKLMEEVSQIPCGEILTTAITHLVDTTETRVEKERACQCRPEAAENGGQGTRHTGKLHRRSHWRGYRGASTKELPILATCADQGW